MAESVGFFEEGNKFAKAIMARSPLKRIAGNNVYLDMYAEYFKYLLIRHELLGHIGSFRKRTFLF